MAKKRDLSKYKVIVIEVYEAPTDEQMRKLIYKKLKGNPQKIRQLNANAIIQHDSEKEEDIYHGGYMEKTSWLQLKLRQS